MAAGGYVYFGHYASGSLMRCSATPGDIVVIRPPAGSFVFYTLTGLVGVGDAVYFAAAASVGGGGTELWRADASGAAMVCDIDTRASPNNSSAPTSLTRVGNGTLVFAASDAAGGRELWATDGTAAGTRRLADVNPGAGDADPVPVAVVGDTVYFAASAPTTGRELWRADLYEPPAVASAAPNPGAAQRSRVTSLAFTFDRPVLLDPGAFALGGAAAAAGVTVSAANPSGDGTSWVLTFAGTGIVGGSLADGAYDLRVVAANVHTRAGTAAGPAMTADYHLSFHRLFGDGDGDGDVDGADSRGFRTALGSAPGDANYNPVFDYDADGDVDGADSRQFRTRLGTSV